MKSVLLLTVCIIALFSAQSAFAQDESAPRSTEQTTRETPAIDTESSSGKRPNAGLTRTSKDSAKLEDSRQKQADAQDTTETKSDAKRSDLFKSTDPTRTESPSRATPMSLTNGDNKTGVSAQTISVPKGPGTVEGMGESFSTQSSTGVAGFQVPFALPAARGGAQPSLGLLYSTGSGSGIAGIGWNVGVPFIARQTDRGIPRYNDQSTWHPNQDRFVFNGGQELVAVSQLLPGEELPEWVDAT
jgi:hypothetical protein